MPTPTRAQLERLPYETLKALELLAPVFDSLLDRVEVLEKALIAKNIGPPGVVTIDPVVTQFVKDYCWKLECDVDTLQREGMSYKGVYSPDAIYPRGSVVTRNGSWWLAEHTVEPNEMPGHEGTNWKLCVKGDRREKPK